MTTKILVVNSGKSRVQEYLNTHYGKELLKRHSLTDTGVWSVKGEDPNADFGGNHYEPDLGNYRGKLSNVLEVVTKLPRFWSWGGGGKISLAEPIDVIDVAED